MKPDLELVIKIIALLTAIIALASVIVSSRKNKDTDSKTNIEAKKTNSDLKELLNFFIFIAIFMLGVPAILIAYKWLFSILIHMK